MNPKLKLWADRVVIATAGGDHVYVPLAACRDRATLDAWLAAAQARSRPHAGNGYVPFESHRVSAAARDEAVRLAADCGGD